MFDLGVAPVQEELLVQDEPALEIALPQVFEQPILSVIQRGKLTDVPARIQHLCQTALVTKGGLGTDYQEFVHEFEPLFTWTTACWDFLLSTEGCRFVPRFGEQRFGVRGDYRAFTDKDYSRLVHRIFRAGMLEFGAQPADRCFAQWLREQFWPRILEAYRQLDRPADPKQRSLTPYSYLRCVPYTFLNDFHDELVRSAVSRLAADERQAIDWYFLHFYTEPATAQALGRSAEASADLLRHALVKLLIHHRLSYCLLRQIERY